MDSVGSNVYWKRKLGYINRKIKEPAEDNPTYDDLECENLLTVMTWLISSMDKCQHWPFILQNCKRGLGYRCQVYFLECWLISNLLIRMRNSHHSARNTRYKSTIINILIQSWIISNLFLRPLKKWDNLATESVWIWASFRSWIVERSSWRKGLPSSIGEFIIYTTTLKERPVDKGLL